MTSNSTEQTPGSGKRVSRPREDEAIFLAEAATRIARHLTRITCLAIISGTPFYRLGTPFDGTPFDGTPFYGLERITPNMVEKNNNKAESSVESGKLHEKVLVSNVVTAEVVSEKATNFQLTSGYCSMGTQLTPLVASEYQGVIKFAVKRELMKHRVDEETDHESLEGNSLRKCSFLPILSELNGQLTEKKENTGSETNSLHNSEEIEEKITRKFTDGKMSLIISVERDTDPTEDTHAPINTPK
ncbi:unnamed protein product [Camellia sinensis]